MTVPPEPAERPTRIRYRVVALATLMSLLLYLDRFYLSYIVPFLQEGFGLGDFQAGVLLGAFFFSYALGQVPSGWFSDRFGARGMLTAYIVLWSLFTALMGVATSFLLLVIFRVGFGFAQAGAYPTSASIISKWVTFAGRGTASGVVAVGGRLGGSLAPVLTAYVLVAFVPVSVSSVLAPGDVLRPGELLKAPQGGDPAEPLHRLIVQGLPDSPSAVESMPPQEQAEVLTTVLNRVLERKDLYEVVHPGRFKLAEEADRLASRDPADLSRAELLRRNRLLLEAAFPQAVRKVYGLGWRPVAILYGLVGLAVGGLFWLGVRNRPEDHPRCNPAEVQRIEAGRPASTVARGKVASLPLKYIVRNRSLWLSSASQFGTNFGWIFLAGLLPVYLAEVHHVPPLERGWMASLPLFIGMAGMLGGGWLTDRLTRRIGLRWGRGLPMALTRFTAMAGFLLCLVVADPWLQVAAFCLVAFSTDLGTAAVWAFKQDVGGKYVGSILGWGNMWGNFGAGVALVTVPAIGGPDKWTWRFLACALAFAFSGVTALGVDATRPVVPEGGAGQGEEDSGNSNDSHQ